MSENIELNYLWEHTITKILKDDPESELGIMFKQWIIFKSWTIST